MEDPKGYYAVLEINPRASKEVIAAAYKTLAKKYHPDIAHSDGKIFRLLTEAYELLMDDEKRQSYNLSVENLAGKVVGEYRVTERIAEGVLGWTYKGFQTVVGEPICLKHCAKLDARAEAVLIDEARAVWDLRHFALPAMRNLLRLEDGSLGLVMSYVPGPTLEQLVSKVGKIDCEHVMWITERILNALWYLHDHKVIHGDIKPQNVIIQPEHTVVLIDYGLSLVRPTDDSKGKGYTVYFAPPEQIEDLAISYTADFYSLGMTMIYALTGKLDRVKSKEVPAFVDNRICDFISRMIVRDPAARPDSARKLFKEIQQLRVDVFGRAHTGMSPIPGL